MNNPVIWAWRDEETGDSQVLPGDSLDAEDAPPFRQYVDANDPNALFAALEILGYVDRYTYIYRSAFGGGEHSELRIIKQPEDPV